MSHDKTINTYKYILKNDNNKKQKKYNVQVSIITPLKLN